MCFSPFVLSFLNADDCLFVQLQATGDTFGAEKAFQSAVRVTSLMARELQLALKKVMPAKQLKEHGSLMSFRSESIEA